MRRVLGRQHHSQSRRRHMLQMVFLAPAMSDPGPRVRWKMRVPKTPGDFASDALEPSCFNQRVNGDLRLVDERVIRCQENDETLLEQRPIVDSIRHALDIPGQGDIYFA